MVQQRLNHYDFRAFIPSRASEENLGARIVVVVFLLARLHHYHPLFSRLVGGVLLRVQSQKGMRRDIVRSITRGRCVSNVIFYMSRLVIEL